MTNDRSERFVRYLEEHRNDPALLGSLRSFTPHTPNWVMNGDPLQGWWARIPRHDQRPFAFVAHLFSLHPHASWAPFTNLGTFMADLAPTLPADSLEPRLKRLYALRYGPGVEGEVRSFVLMARNGRIEVPYANLLRDLQHWDAPERDVQHRILTSFFHDSATSRHDPAKILR